MTAKRRAAEDARRRPAKRRRLSDGAPSTDRPPQMASPAAIHHPVLSRFYPRVCTLRAFLVEALPPTSCVRRRRLARFGHDDPECLLDSCLVGVAVEPSLAVRQDRQDDYLAFTQSQNRATGADPSRCRPSDPGCMSEVTDFVVWSLFRNAPRHGNRTRHLLCHGLQRATAPHAPGTSQVPTAVLPGIARHHPNPNLDQIHARPWPDILALLGTGGDVILAGLFLDCGIFTKLASGKDNYFQLSGIPVANLSLRHPAAPIGKLPATATVTAVAAAAPSAHDEHRQPSQVRFLRNRILYGRPSLNAAGRVEVGLPHTHVLRRFPDWRRDPHAIRVLMYLFPRQFRLHNVFTSKVDPAETAQPFKDYTFREMELPRAGLPSRSRLPPRLRGRALELVQAMQKNHRACAYSQLLRHYCPVGAAVDAQQPGDASFLVHATPPAHVSAFCRSVLTHLLPAHTWGTGEDGRNNWSVLAKRIDEFVHMRRFESMTLHAALQRLRLRAIDWLGPARPRGPAQGQGQGPRHPMAQSDGRKRRELLGELVYYVFDSLLIPLLRATFYVTESGGHRNRLFYFRHDVWRKLAEPSFAALRSTMFVALAPSEARRILQSRPLGYSQIRLLPKDQGARPITNLRRRQARTVAGQRRLGSSVNAQLGPLFSVLTFERGRDADAVGSALQSVGGLHARLVAFKQTIPCGARLFFAKVDITSCFDSLPQEHLLDIVETLFREPAYRTTKHSEMKPIDHSGDDGGDGVGAVTRRFIGTARAADHHGVFAEPMACEVASRKRRVVLADTGNHKVWSRGALVQLLREHVTRNVVKMGRRHVRQADGIPQGSVLSSLLCSVFYGAFERRELAFLDPRTCLLLRLVDDFLLISTDETLARRFLAVMAQGDARYGIRVNAAKSLANFDVAIRGHRVPRPHGTVAFPYCGVTIDMRSLELTKDRDRKDGRIGNALTVETSGRAGRALRRKTLASVKLHMHAMLLDRSLNSWRQVVRTLLGNFVEAAMKMHRSLASFRGATRPDGALVRALLAETVVASTKICWAKAGYDRPITTAQMAWMAASAFEAVLRRKQAQYRDTLVWLGTLRAATEAKMKLSRAALGELLAETERLCHGCAY